MPMAKLTLKPGVLAVASQLLAENSWWASSLIRFFQGMVQKLGGWRRLTNTPFIGTARGMHGWSDLNGNPYLAVGTEQRLEVFAFGVLADITPLRQTDIIVPNFSTTMGQVAVGVNDPANGADAGDWIFLVTTIAIGGLSLAGYYQIQSITDPNNYIINAATAASSTATGGTVTGATTSPYGAGPYGAGPYGVGIGNKAIIEYLLSTGYAANTAVTGYGTGPYGGGPYGIGGGGQIIEPLRCWSMDNWGQLLLASPTNGAIYSWNPPNTAIRAAIVGTAPLKNWSIFVIGQLQILVSLGSSIGGAISGQQYPNLVSWSDVGDYTDFTPSATNEAGSFQIPNGSNIVAGLAVGLGALIWTDLDLWSMVYEGLPFVFGFNRVAVNCETVSSRAPAVIGNAVMWPSIRGFYRYDGSGVNFFPCPVWDFMFSNMDYGQLAQIFSAVNTPFNEVAWYFPFDASSKYYSSATPMGYVKFNAQDGVWDYGVSYQLQRTAWIDHPGFGSTPVGADLAGLLQNHETSPDADGQPLAWSITSGYFDIQQGEEFGFIDWWLPDIVATPSTATVSITVTATDYSGDPPRTYGPYTFQPTTEFLTLGVRGRQAAIMLSGNDLGSSVRMGASRYRIQRDGRN